MNRGDDGPIRVLHVDDEAEFTEVVSLHLERAHDDISVVSETSVAAGLDRLAAEPIDCVVSDHDMPEKNGLDFLRDVRDEYPELPFVLFTGKGSEEIASEAISAGVTEYLQKGTGTDQFAVLANRIERAVAERRARLALEESERMVSTLISNLPGMVYRCYDEPGWPMTFVSEGARDLTGYDPEDIESGAVEWGSDVLVPEDRERMREAVDEALAADEAFEVTYRIRTRSGERRWVWERGCAVGERDGRTVLEGFVTDITASRERELDRYRRLVENVGDPMYVLDDAGRIEMVNEAMAELLGRPREEIVGESAGAFMPDEDVETAKRVIRDVLEDDDAQRGRFETHSIGADGDVRYHEDKITVLTDEDGEFAGSIGVVRDITDRKEKERELERFETIIQAVGDPVYTLDENGVITFVNDAMLELSGYDREDLLGAPAGTLISADDVATAESLIGRLIERDSDAYDTLELTLETRSGEIVPCEIHVALLPFDDGEFRGTAGVVRDITERKRRERRLEEFASVVSHDLRSPLTVIQGIVEYVEDTGDVDKLSKAADAADRMEDLIEDLLDLAREGAGVGDRERVDVAETARTAWDRLGATDAELVVNGGGTVHADPTRLEELFDNLFRNAVDHGRPDEGDGGELAVTVGATETGFYVEDDGQGIPPDERADVFERGYTNSADGTGFGLAIVRDVAEAHGWTVRATEGSEGGARFEIDT